MAFQERELIHSELLETLFKARKQVEQLEAALAHNAAFLGTGIERERQQGAGPSANSAGALENYLELVGKEDDISDFIGRQGHEESRPRLGADAPPDLRPKDAPAVSPLVREIAFFHPDDAISFTSPPDSPAELAALSPGGVKSFAGEEALSPPKARAEPLPEPWALPPDGGNSLGMPLALQVIQDGLLSWNLQTGSVFRSQRWKELLPADAGAASPADSLASCLHSADAGPLLARFADLIEGKISNLHMPIRIKRPGDAWSWGLLRAASLGAGNGALHITAALTDNTVQREAELALRSSEEKFRALAEDSPDFIGRFDRQGHFLYASPNINRYLSALSEDLIGKPLSASSLLGEVAFFEETLNRVFEMGLPIQTEVHLISPLVGEFVADCRFWPEFSPAGQVTSVTTQLRDMTFSRRMAENYQALFTSMVDGFALFQHIPGKENASIAYAPEEFTLIAMNPSLGTLFALDASKSIGLRLNELLNADAEQWAACLSKVLSEKTPGLCSLHRAERGGVFEISAYSPEEGCVACIVKNVTELHEIEKELRLNEARFAALYRLSHMDAAPEEEVARFSLDQAVSLTGSSIGYLYVPHGHDGDSGRVYWSRQVVEQFGDPPPVPDLCMQAGMNGGSAESMEVLRAEVVNDDADEAMRAFGQKLPVTRYMLAPVVEDGRVVCIAGVANKERKYETTDLRQLELFLNGMWFQLRRRWGVQALRRAKDAAEAANRAKNEFLANVSHELRTPLNGILGMLQVLQQSPLTAEQTECVVTANYSGRSLLRIISDILDFSRIEAGRFELSSQIFDFAATVRSTLGMFIHQAEQKRIKFSLNISDKIPSALIGDDARVRQIIFNLVGNAFKFIEQGEIAVECGVLPFCRKGKCCIYLAVSDSGIGIPDDRLGDIFSAFTQLDGSSTRRYSGTGLGLAIVRRLVQLMDGSLAVESIVGEGTSIHCSLPFDWVGVLLAEEVQERVKMYEPRPLDILVVEDDPVNQMTLRSLLKKAGHSCMCVGDGRQALEALLLHSFECIITDVQMPVMDGVELAGRIRDNNLDGIQPSEQIYALLGVEKATAPLMPVFSDIPIIALTAHAMTGDRERFLSMGMDYYMAKPIVVSELMSTLAHVSARIHD